MIRHHCRVDWQNQVDDRRRIADDRVLVVQIAIAVVLLANVPQKRAIDAWHITDGSHRACRRTIAHRRLIDGQHAQLLERNAEDLDRIRPEDLRTAHLLGGVCDQC